MTFEFATAARIIFGNGKLNDIGAYAAEMGKKALVATFRTLESAEPLRERLASAGVETVLFAVSGEPTTDMIEGGVRLAKESGCDLVIAFGGGSVIDAGKAIAALATNPGEVLDYLEVIGKGQPLEHAPLSSIAIPTTAGTGAEVTKNAVLASKVHRVKVSLRHPLMLPRIALVDPELTYALPPEITAATGMDALTQVLEPFVSNAANPMTDSFCREGLHRGARSLRRAYAGDESAREDMALASLFGGLALANAKLGAVHGFAGVLGGMYDAPHGAVCATLLPHVMAVNVRALAARDPHNIALSRYDEIAQILTGDEDAKAAEGVAWASDLRHDLNIPTLSAFGIQQTDFPTIIEKSRNASSMKGNPLKLTDDELHEILEMAL